MNVTGTKDLRAQAPHATLTMDLKDFRFFPSFLHVTPGEMVTIKLVNPPGPVTEPNEYYIHTFTIDSLNIDVTVNHGETKTVTFTVPRQPSVVFVCTPHQQFGMQGALYTS